MVRERGIMTPLVLGLGVPELLIILAVVLLLFGGARLAGLGKSTGRALREFKEETKGLKSDESQQQPPLNPGPGAGAPSSTDYQPPPPSSPRDPTKILPALTCATTPDCLKELLAHADARSSRRTP